MPRTKKQAATETMVVDGAQYPELAQAAEAAEKANKGAAAPDAREIVVKPIKITRTRIWIVGDSPLIVHAWGPKAKREMLEAQKKERKEKKARPIRDEFAEFMEALYWLTPMPEEYTVEAFEAAWEAGAKFGFPTIAIKKAALAACYRAGIIPNQVGMRCSFKLRAVDGINLNTGSELCVIETDEPPRMREDMVKIGGISKVADLRYRPEFRNWKMHLEVELIELGTFSMESIINAVNLGGFMNGLGEWRMERDGDFGSFHIELDD